MVHPRPIHPRFKLWVYNTLPVHHIKYVTLLWAFPCPRTISTVGSNGELSHLVNVVIENHEDCHFKFHDSTRV